MQHTRLLLSSERERVLHVASPAFYFVTVGRSERRKIEVRWTNRQAGAMPSLFPRLEDAVLFVADQQANNHHDAKDVWRSRSSGSWLKVELLTPIQGQELPCKPDIRIHGGMDLLVLSIFWEFFEELLLRYS